MSNEHTDLQDIGAELTDMGYQIEAYPDDVDIPEVIAKLRAIIAKLEARDTTAA